MGSSSSIEIALLLNAVSVAHVLSIKLSDVASIISTSESSSELKNMRREGLYFLEFGWFDSPGSPAERLWMSQADVKNWWNMKCTDLVGLIVMLVQFSSSLL